ncbi:MAG: hypothetical protein ACK2UC_13550 [Anaerolineae bacterium]
MSQQAGVPVYLEIGRKRTFAGAIRWPGWCRSARDEASALQALVDYAPRYARALQSVRLAFEIPGSRADLVVEERLSGTSTTDFGAPAVTPEADQPTIRGQELGRLDAVLTASWLAFEDAVSAAEGKTLRKGPRGGGRDLPGIVNHVVQANEAYLRKLAWRPDLDPSSAPADQLGQLREEVSRALAAAAAGDLPSTGPRGGKLWAPRFFVRRAAWHMLDHAWEIEDRIL